MPGHSSSRHSLSPALASPEVLLDLELAWAVELGTVQGSLGFPAQGLLLSGCPRAPCILPTTQSSQVMAGSSKQKPAWGFWPPRPGESKVLSLGLGVWDAEEGQARLGKEKQSIHWLHSLRLSGVCVLVRKLTSPSTTAVLGHSCCCCLPGLWGDLGSKLRCTMEGL